LFKFDRSAVATSRHSAGSDRPVHAAQT